ncbi:MAG: CerR family C-terminal domain-containing protein [Azonexus sp.]|jgi:AcrR family transcriptional regulator|uniref:TetR/AcrR family transcriptional regulator n=1 Tax=Azonexus sp. TaxID=1872668 RepID=UPI00282F4F24|nr:CerR family C-terminal domain-containing protein [Azonexus sp.]MDR0776415.1 CerR family C-terminal domain-containing protein [Azonexus sp.]
MNTTIKKRGPRADGDATRANLLEAAGQLFAQLGYAGASNKAICEAAGADLAAINYHFGGREGLYRSVLLEGYSQLVDIAALREIAARNCTAEEKLAATFGLIVDRAKDERGWHGRVFAREILAPSAHTADLVKEGMAPRFALLGELVAEITGLPRTDPAFLRCMTSVIAPCLMMLVLDRETPNPFRALLEQPAEQLKSHLTGFALAGLREVSVPTGGDQSSVRATRGTLTKSRPGTSARKR